MSKKEPTAALGAGLLLFAKQRTEKRGHVPATLVPYIIVANRTMGMSTRAIAEYFRRDGQRISHTHIHRLITREKEVNRDSDTLARYTTLARVLPDLERIAEASGATIRDLLDPSLRNNTLRNAPAPCPAVPNELAVLPENETALLVAAWDSCLTIAAA